MSIKAMHRTLNYAPQLWLRKRYYNYVTPFNAADGKRYISEDAQWIYENRRKYNRGNVQQLP